MSLNFQHLFHRLTQIAEDLNGAWPIRLSQARENQRALVTDQDLRIGQVLLVTEDLLRMGFLLFLLLDSGDLANTSLRVCRVDKRFNCSLPVTLLTIRLKACNGAEIDHRWKFKGPSWANLASRGI